MAAQERIEEIIARQSFEQVQQMTTSLTALNAVMEKSILSSLELSKAQGGQTLAQTTKKVKELTAADVELSLQTKKYKQELTDTVRATSTAVDAYAKLELAYKTSKREALNFAATHGVNSREFKEASANAAKYKATIDQANKATGDHTKNVGNYGTALKGLGTQLLAAAGLTAGLALAVKGVKAIIESTGKTSDEFAFKLEGVKQATNFLGRSIATLDFSNIIDGFRNANTEGRRYAGVLDLLGDLQRSERLQILDIDTEIINLTTLAKLNKASVEDKKKYIDQIIALEQKKLSISLQIGNKAVDNELKNAEQITGVQEYIIKSFITDYGGMLKMIEEGRIIDEKLRAASTAMINTLDDRGRATQTAGFSQDIYNQKLKELSSQDRIRVQLLKVENILVDEKREKITASMEMQKRAYKESAEGESMLVKLKNRLSNEILKGDEKVKGGIAEVNDELDEEKKKLAEIRAELGRGALENMLSNTTLVNVSGLVDNMYQILEVQEKIDKKTADIAKQHKDNADAYEGVKMGWQSAIDQAIAADMEMQELLKNLKEELEQLAATTVGNIISDQISSSYADQIGKMREEMESWHEEQLNQLEERRDKGLLTDQQYQAAKERIEKQYEQKQKANRVKEAQLNKEDALYQIAIQTAVAIIKTLAVLGFTPAGLVAAALAGAEGLAQAAVVSAKPLPKYAKGREGGPAELAIVGEAGTEVVTGQKGTYVVDQPSVVKLGAGDSVLNMDDINKLSKQMSFSFMPTFSQEKRKEQNTELLTEKIVEAIKSKKETHINITKEGMFKQVNDNGNWQNWINQNIKH